MCGDDLMSAVTHTACSTGTRLSVWVSSIPTLRRRTINHSKTSQLGSAAIRNRRLNIHSISDLDQFVAVAVSHSHRHTQANSFDRIIGYKTCASASDAAALMRGGLAVLLSSLRVPPDSSGHKCKRRDAREHRSVSRTYSL